VQNMRQVAQTKPHVVGFAVYSVAYNNVKEMIQEMRAILPETKIVIGGPHVSALPAWSLKDTKADFAVVGEGEEIMVELVRRIEAGVDSFDDLKGLAFWKNGEVVVNEGCNVIENLDDLSFPAWELLSPENYNDSFGQVFSAEVPVMSIFTSRGCPHQCTFCASRFIHGRVFRRRSARNVVDEIETLVKDHGVKEIEILDDTFTESAQHAMDICRELKRRNLSIKWRAAGGLRLNTINDELLALFKETGCYQVSIGIESASERVLRQIRKPIDPAQIKNRIRMVKKYGIKTIGFFIIGLPGDTEESIRETIAFAKNSDLDLPLFMQAIPLPGTEVFKNAYSPGDLQLVPWDDFHFFSGFPFKICPVPIERLQYLFTLAHFQTYFTVKRIAMIFRFAFSSKRIRMKKILRWFCYHLKSVFFLAIYSLYKRPQAQELIHEKRVTKE